MTTAADTALWLATHRGWRVFPLSAGKKPLAGCDRCRSESPLPVDEQCRDHATCECLARGDGAHCHAVYASTSNPDVIRHWARTHTRVWAVDCGRSGLLCVDLDAHGGTSPQQPLNGRLWPSETPSPGDGVDVWAALCGLVGAPVDTDTTLTVDTPSGGLHLYYAVDAGRWSGATPRVHGDRVTSGLGWQIDVKAHGGYVVLPGSVSDTGTYQRTSSTLDPAPLPSWLVTELRRVGLDRQARADEERLRRATYRPPSSTISATSTAAGGTRGARYAAQALSCACAELAAMEPGTGRNSKLFRSASRLAGMVDAGWIDQDQVERDLSDAARAALLPASEITYAIRSGFAHPRRIDLPERAA